MNACELTMSITAIANGIAKNFDDDHLGLLGAAFTQLGDTLTTIATQRALCQSKEGSAQAAVNDQKNASV